MLLTLSTNSSGSTALRSVLPCRGSTLLFVRANSENLKLLRCGTSEHSGLLIDAVWVHSSVNVITVLCEIGHVRLLATENVAVGVDSRIWHADFFNFVHRHVKGRGCVLALWSLTCVLDSIKGLNM